MSNELFSMDTIEPAKIETINPETFKNFEYILKDILQGDPEALTRPEFSGLNIDQIKAALDFILHDDDLSDTQKSDLLANSWRVNYKDKPPTPEEFLTEKYLGPVADTIFPWVREDFINFFDPTKPYRTLVLYSYIGYGKSFFTVLCNMYIAVHLSMMRAVWRYLNHSPATVYCLVYCATSLKKSSELLLEPMVNMLEASPFFEKIHTRDAMSKREEDFARMNNIDRIFWTTAVPTSAIQFSGAANVKLISSPNGLLGAAQPLYSKIKKPDGSWTTMGKLQLGEKIASPSEEETEVVGIFPQGKIACYEVELIDGRKTKCSIHHRWRVGYKISIDSEIIFADVELQFMLDHSDYEFYILDEADCYEDAFPELEEALFTFPPYSLKERWGEAIHKTADEWIDLCLEKYECTLYLFVVDDTLKYRDKIIEIVSNKSHFSLNEEKVILIKKDSL